MMSPVTASVRQRLLNRSRDTGENFNSLLVRYGIERLLYRLAQSEHIDAFILKGSTLFHVWTGSLHRPTKDVDMLHLGPTEPGSMEALIRACVMARVMHDDGIRFDEGSIVACLIGEAQSSPSVRVTLKAYLGKAQIALQLDIGVGDAVTPDPVMVDYPGLLDMPAARLRAYRFETAIAEKCEAMVKLGLTNTRLKDFYDVFVLARDHEFEGAVLGEALGQTFARRHTALPEGVPVAWSQEFGQDAHKRTQWRAFLRKSRLEAPELMDVITCMGAFLMPVLDATRTQEDPPGTWRSGSWHPQ